MTDGKSFSDEFLERMAAALGLPFKDLSIDYDSAQAREALAWAIHRLESRRAIAESLVNAPRGSRDGWGVVAYHRETMAMIDIALPHLRAKVAEPQKGTAMNNGESVFVHVMQSLASGRIGIDELRAIQDADPRFVGWVETITGLDRGDVVQIAKEGRLGITLTVLPEKEKR